MRIACVLGCWLGALDGVAAARAPMPLLDRLGTVAVAIAVDGLALTLIGAAFTALIWAIRRGRPATAAAGWPSKRGALLWVGLAWGAGLSGAVVARSDGSTEAGGRDGRPSIVLISVDTLRADHLTPYGYARDTSPHLAELARQGVVFENAYSHSTWTLPAHASLLTGLDPIAHGVRDDRTGLHPSIHTLAERLGDVGYETVAWVGTPAHGYVGARYGLAAGFDRYVHYPHPRRFRSATLPRILDALVFELLDREVGNASAQVDAIEAWLAVRGDAPFFLFVHFYDVHSKTARLPYEAPDRFRERFCEAAPDEAFGCSDGRCASDRLIAIADGEVARPGAAELEQIRCLYDGGIAFVDEEIGRLVGAVEAAASDEDVVVVVTSDHGEAFFEHGKPLHVTLHDEIVRIPLIVRGPGFAAGKRARGVVALADVTPTILELVEGAETTDVQGRSLSQALRVWSADVDHDVIALDDGKGGMAIRRRDDKLIVRSVRGAGTSPSRSVELYSLDEDAGETWSRHATDRDRVGELTDAMRVRVEAGEALHERLVGGTRAERVVLSEDERERLRALGYVDGPAGEAGAEGVAGAKDERGADADD